MIDRFSETWKAVRDTCAAEIELHRTALEDSGMSEKETAIIRGQIMALRWVIAFDDRQKPEQPPYVADASGY